MSIKIYYGNVNKKINSTFRPTLLSSFDCVLKEGTFEDSPTFLLAMSSFAYNYIIWNNNYYFVESVKFVRNNLIEVSCTLDVLATYKDDILLTNAFVKYYTHNNTEIVDNRLSVNTTKVLSYNSGLFDYLGSGTCAIVNITGKDSCASFALNVEQARTLLNNLDNWYDDPNTQLPQEEVWNPTIELEALKHIGQEIWYSVKQILSSGKASDSIKSAYIIPIDKDDIETATSNIYLGQYDTGVTGLRITNRILTDGIVLNIPWQATDWRRNSPYHELYLYLPFIGVIELSTSDLIGETNINIDVTIDVTSGDCVFTVYGANGHFIGQYNSNIAGQFAIGASNVTPAQITTSIMQGIGVGALAMSTGGSSLLITGGALGITNGLIGQPSTIGGNTGGASIGINPTVYLYSIFHDTTVEPNSISSTLGTPANKQMNLSGITGYCQCVDAHVSAPAHADQLNKIDNFLNNGFFIE